jgi:hypothetical protein
LNEVRKSQVWRVRQVLEISVFTGDYKSVKYSYTNPAYIPEGYETNPGER